VLHRARGEVTNSEERIVTLDVSSLTLDEVFRIAIRLEEDGIEFYKVASEKLSTKRLRDVLDSLVVEELEHKMTFQGMARGRGIYLSPDPGFEDISPQTMQALVDAEVFPSPEERDLAIASLHSPAQVLRFAIRVEKGSIHFYRQATKAAKSEKVREAFDKILGQEHQHFRLLSAELKALKVSGAF